MRITLLLRSLLSAYLLYLSVFLLTAYSPEHPGFDPPFAIVALDAVNLFIHEAGHLFFKPLGMWFHIVGGSFLQVALPLALVLVTFRENIHHAFLPGFWFGESLVNVSAYIRDAPYMKLKLIARGLTHDWNYLIGGDAGTAAFVGGAVFVLGIILAFAACVHGGFQVWKEFRAGGRRVS